MRQRIDTDPWARHAGASNGFADIGAAYDFFTTPADGHAPLRERLLLIGTRLQAAARAARAWLRAANERRQRRSEARAMYEALRGLDDRMLHDLGVSRSELGSVAAEASGLAERTRVNTLHTTYGLPG